MKSINTLDSFLLSFDHKPRGATVGGKGRRKRVLVILLIAVVRTILTEKSTGGFLYPSKNAIDVNDFSCNRSSNNTDRKIDWRFFIDIKKM